MCPPGHIFLANRFSSDTGSYNQNIDKRLVRHYGLATRGWCYAVVEELLEQDPF